MNQYVDNILHAFAQLDDDNQQLQRIQTLAPELNWVEDADIDQMISSLAELAGGISPNILDRGLEIVVRRLGRNAAENLASPDKPGIDAPNPHDDPRRLKAIRKLYLALPSEARSRNYLLNWLATVTSEAALLEFCQLCIEAPPTCPSSIVVAFAPLLQHNKPFETSYLFPELLGGLQHPSIAAAILDLANFVTREKRVAEHPAADHSESLIRMLGMLTEQLAMLEEGKIPAGKSAPDISRMVNDTVSLIASLCDSLSLIKNEAAIGKLNRAAELKHRRIRTEALSALCSLGQESSGEELVKLAAEPVTRLRVLQYADELGLSDDIDDEFTTEVARAESQLAMWLAHPSNMGLAPKGLEILDERRLAWPGYDDPTECYLFRYSYELASSKIENIGIAGPLVHAFSMNMQHLNICDMYACFAGWHCNHDEIMEMSIPQARLQRPGMVERLMSRLSSEMVDGLSINECEPLFLGLFMGEESLIVSATIDEQQGTFVVDRDKVLWFPPDADMSPARNELAYCIYKGRRLLGAFNQPEIWPGIESIQHE